MEKHRDERGGPDFEQVFLPHLDAAFNLARWLLRNDQDAEDAVQESYLRAYKSFGRFRGGEGKAWLMTIVRNVCFTVLKKARGQGVAEPYDEEIHHEASLAEEREAFRRKANAETLQRGLEKLADEERELIVLHDLEGLAYKEIAVVVGIPIGTVMSRLSRARARLRTVVAASDTKQFLP
jgi:RNA polymerase sigma-70 factor, ECF subfamily